MKSTLILVTLLVSVLGSHAFAGPKERRADRKERRHDRREHRQDRREDRREDRQERREERREDRHDANGTAPVAVPTEAVQSH